MRVRNVFLPDYPLILSLFKLRNVGVFLNQQMSIPNKESRLNNSIDKHIIHKMHKSTKYIRKIERHNYPFIITISYLKGGFIYLRKDSGSMKLVKKANMKENQEAVLDGNLINHSTINTHFPYFIFI